MSDDAVARRYARALFEIGKEGGDLPKVTKDVGAYAEALEGSTELRVVLGDPLVDAKVREGILDELGQQLGATDAARNTMRLLARRRRTSLVPALHRELERLADEDAGVVRAFVTSARPLSASYLDRLRAELEKTTGRKVVVSHREDASLLAGVVTRIGDRVIDGSVRARLAAFKDSLLSQ